MVRRGPCGSRRRGPLARASFPGAARGREGGEPAPHPRVPSCLPARRGAAQVKVWFQNRRMKWRHSKEAQAQKDKDKEAGEKPSGGAAAADGEREERSPSRSEGEAESESSDSESLDMAPSDTERTEGADRALHQATVIKASAGGGGGSAGSGGGGGSFGFGSLGGGGASELLPAPQPPLSGAPQSPEPAQAPLSGL